MPNNFEKNQSWESVVERMTHLYRIDIDARVVFEKALDMVQEGYLQKHLINYLNDHQHHLNHFRAQFEERGLEVPTPSQDIKGRFYEVLTTLASTGGEDAVLKALKLSEKMVHQEYKKALEEYWPENLYIIIHRHWEDEVRHLHFFDGVNTESVKEKKKRKGDLGWDPTGVV